MATKFYAGQKDYIPKLNEMDQAFQDAMSNMAGATTAPLPDGTAAPGVSQEFARADHVHPSEGQSLEGAIGGTINGNVTVTGNFTVNGTTTQVNSTTVTVEDTILTLGGSTAPTINDNKDRGLEFRWHDGTSAKVGFYGFDRSTGKFTFIPDAANTGEVFTGTVGTITADLEGNSSTASKLQTARTINGTAFDGSANITFDTDAVAEGSTKLYFTESRVRSTLLSGLVTTVNAVVTAADSVIGAIGKLQKQINDLVTTVGNKANSAGAALTGVTTVERLDVGNVLKLPEWTTATRPTNALGRIGYNTDLQAYEGYSNSGWSSIGGGANGGGTDKVFYENDKTVSGSYTITTGKNAMSAGPITVNDGVVVTIPDGSVWTIV